MFGRLWALAGLLVAALALSSAAQAAPASATPHRIVAVGDLHGDYAAWRDIARAARLIDDKGHWIGGDTVFVQTGDVVDRGADSLKIIQDLMRLQGEAKRKKGQVIALVGNHEAMNITDDLRYVTPGEYAAFATRNSAKLRDKAYAANKAAIEAAYRQRDPAATSEAIKAAWMSATPLGMIEHRAAWLPTGKVGKWVITNPAVVVIDGSIFVHGGISAAYSAIPPADINTRVAAALKARETAPTSIINDQTGPLWYRGLVKREASEPPAATDAAAPAPPPAPTVREELDQVLRAYGARRIVIGHTPILSGIAVLEDGGLVRIDTGISAYYGGALSYLEIVGDTLTPHVVERTAAVPGAVH